MQSIDAPDEPPKLEDRLYDIVNRMLAPYDVALERKQIWNALSGPDVPFDITKPTRHSSKADFQQTYETVSKGLEATSEFTETFFPGLNDDQPMPKTVSNLWGEIDLKARLRLNRSGLDLSRSHDLLKKNAIETGLYVQTLTLLLEFQNILLERLAELGNEREEFWNLNHRAPDYYARAIALRLAKLFAKETGRKPTYGQSGETGEPSTTYSRALKEVFGVLQIGAQERNPAEWAVSQISDADLRPVSLGLLGGILGTPAAHSNEDIGVRLGRSPLSKPAKPKGLSRDD